MTTYNVHIYREMRLRFDEINADTPEAAAEIASKRFLNEADHFDDCDGHTFAALVDEECDHDYENSKVIDFEAGRLLDAAPAHHANALYLDSIAPDVESLPDDAPVEIVITAKAIRDIRATIAKATGKAA